MHCQLGWAKISIRRHTLSSKERQQTEGGVVEYAQDLRTTQIVSANHQSSVPDSSRDTPS